MSPNQCYSLRLMKNQVPLFNLVIIFYFINLHLFCFIIPYLYQLLRYRLILNLNLIFIGIATVTMNKPPVNSLNLEFLDEINTQLNKLQKDKIRGMILTSVCIHLYVNTYMLNYFVLKFNFRVCRKFFVQD